MEVPSTGADANGSVGMHTNAEYTRNIARLRNFLTIDSDSFRKRSCGSARIRSQACRSVRRPHMPHTQLKSPAAPDGWLRTAHFNATKTKNVFEHVPKIVIPARTRPPPDDVRQRPVVMTGMRQ